MSRTSLSNSVITIRVAGVASRVDTTCSRSASSASTTTRCISGATSTRRPINSPTASKTAATMTCEVVN